MPAKTDPDTDPQADPTNDDGFTPAQEKRLTEMLADLAKSFTPATQTPASTATAPGNGGSGEPATAPADLAGKIEDAVRAALSRRDDEDRVAFLEAELEKVKSALPKPPEQGWGRWILGGVGR